MIRKINDVVFNGKTYKIGDVTVGDYMLFLDDPNAFIKKVWSEFENGIPKYMTNENLQEIITELFKFLDDGKKKKQLTEEEKKKAEEDSKK